MEENLKKDKNGEIYTGAPVGYQHKWKYENCEWEETKTTPTLWKIQMKSIKRKKQPTKNMGTINPGTMYHWMIVADQYVMKLDENTYKTIMKGNKYKIGHKKEYWKDFSYNYKDQIQNNKNCTQMKLQALNQELKNTTQTNNKETSSQWNKAIKW